MTAGEPSDRDPDGDERGVAVPPRDACFEWLREERFGERIACVHCGSGEVTRQGTTIRDARRYSCKTCERSFNDLTGTVFAHHEFALEDMFYIVCAMDDTPIVGIMRDLERYRYEPVLNFVHKARDARGGDPLLRKLSAGRGPGGPET